MVRLRENISEVEISRAPVMRVIEECGNEELAKVFVAETAGGKVIEFAESIQPPYPREEKWVLIISTLFGCPFKCIICDAGDNYSGKLSAEEMMWQIRYMVERRFPDGEPKTRRLKIHFARMGDPALNPAVLDVLRELPKIYPAEKLMPSISTTAPKPVKKFFEELLEIKDLYYSGGRFQMQFSLHTTDEEARKKIVRAKTWSFREMAEYGERFVKRGDRKVTLNFATPAGYPLEPEQILPIFSPEYFAIKLTPVNPTYNSERFGLSSAIDPYDMERSEEIARRFRDAGYFTILSIGELEENEIGSNCGMMVIKLREKNREAAGAER